MPVCRSCADEKPAEEFPLRCAKKGVRQQRCRVCTRVYAREWYKKNADRHRDNVRKWKRKHPEKVQQYKRSDVAKAWDKQWRHNNPHIRRANAARYRALKRDKTPVLTPLEQVRIKEFYRRARELTKKTGVQHHVDHLIPLAHPNGFHHPDNLQVIPAAMNLKKSNKLTLDTLATSPVFTIDANEA